MFPTLHAMAWLKQLSLSVIESLEIDHLIVDLERSQQQILKLE